jgi:hypothetical protein
MERILNEEQEILVKTISHKMQETEHRCRVLEGQLAQSNRTVQELRRYEQKSD